MKTATVLWDNDGVLVDTEELYFRACREVLADHGLDLTHDYYRRISLRQGASVFDQLLDRGATEAEVLELRQRRDNIYTRLLMEKPRVRLGAQEALKKLKSRLEMGVVTSTLRQHFLAAHRSSGLLEYLGFVITREDYQLSKPHPEPYLTALSRQGLRKDRCVAVEDSERGLRSALAAGIRCYIIPTAMTAGADFTGAHLVLENLDQLTEVLLREAVEGPQDLMER